MTRTLGRALVGCAIVLVTLASPASAQPDAALLDALRAGGFILYFRHADTDHRQQDQRTGNFDDCTTQRNLTDRGRDHARNIGELIRKLGIPVGVVLASPLCRTVETAVLAFGAAEKSMAVREGGQAPPGDPARYAALRTLLSTMTRAGTNIAIVGHGYPYYSLVGGQVLDEGQAAIVRPEGTAFREIARVGLKEWRALADLPR